ncbi:MAG: CpsD/CapB family tyrosine-protein kinase [Pseudomonadota bacterium]
MERLQEALQKAREKREGVPSQPMPVRSVQGSVPAAWEALKPFEPDLKLLERNRIVATKASKSSAPFDILRTKVLLNMRKNGWTRLALTSPTAACGKTTTACNLALGFSRQPDVRTCLFEFDLRRPSIARNLNLSLEHDITEVLAGDVSFSEQALRYQGNVAVLAAKQAHADPTAIMLQSQTHEVLEQIEKRYALDLAIFDLPPLLAGDETRAFLKEVDCALMVALAETSTTAQIDACEREMAEHCNVLGVVLNYCRLGDDGVQSYGSY